MVRRYRLRDSGSAHWCQVLSWWVGDQAGCVKFGRHAFSAAFYQAKAWGLLRRGRGCGAQGNVVTPYGKGNGHALLEPKALAQVERYGD